MSADFVIVKRRADGSVRTFTRDSGTDTGGSSMELEAIDAAVVLMVDGLAQLSEQRDAAWERYAATR